MYNEGRQVIQTRQEKGSLRLPSTVTTFHVKKQHDISEENFPFHFFFIYIYLFLFIFIYIQLHKYHIEQKMHCDSEKNY